MDERALLFAHLPDGILSDSHITIPGLDVPVPYDREEWLEDWAPRILAQRERTHALCARSANERALQMALCRQPHGLGSAYFSIMFGWVYEPRDDDDYAMMPFLLFPRQVELMLVFEGVQQRPKGALANLAIRKARGVGATWCYAHDDLHRWRFKKNYQGRLVSRTEDMVDKKGSSDAWMWKYDYILDRLPQWMLPGEFSTKDKRYRTHMSIINPETGSAIIGEATTSGVGVGGRATRYGVDEAARFRDLRQVAATLQETTNHTVFISTDNVEVNTDFWDMHQGANGWTPPTVFEMPWHCVPVRDEAWLAAARETMPDDMFQREIMMNPWAGISTWVYPSAKQKHPGPHFFRRDLSVCIHGLDDGYDDDFGLIWGQRDRGSGKFIVLDGYEGSHMPIAFYGHLLKGETVGRFPWDYEALRIMAWIREHGTYKGLFVGDRHGDNTDLSSGDSPWQVLTREFGLHVQTNPPHLNGLLERRDALMDLLDNIDFADTPGAMRVLEAVQNHRFPSRNKSAQPTIEARRPIHDWTSHLTTALEYIAVHLRFTGGGLSAARKQPPVNNGWLTSGPRQVGRRNSPDRFREVGRSWIG